MRKNVFLQQQSRRGISHIKAVLTDSFHQNRPRSWSFVTHMSHNRLVRRLEGERWVILPSWIQCTYTGQHQYIDAMRSNWTSRQPYLNALRWFLLNVETIARHAETVRSCGHNLDHNWKRARVVQFMSDRLLMISGYQIHFRCYGNGKERKCLWHCYSS